MSFKISNKKPKDEAGALTSQRNLELAKPCFPPSKVNNGNDKL